MNAPIVPSARAIAALVLLAPLAIVVAALLPSAWWLAPAAAIGLLTAVLIDGWLAGGLRGYRLMVPADGEVGQPLLVTLHVELATGARAAEAAIGFDPRLGEHGTFVIDLSANQDQANWLGTASLQPSRRGTAAIESLAIRWPGPMRLAHRQLGETLARPVRIWPDLSPVRSPALQTLLRDAHAGVTARRVRGEGTQFEALNEYQAGMDRRRIDWKASARHTRLYARENEAERDNQVVFAFDCGQGMSESVDGLPRIDRAVSAALTSAYVALKGGDRVALFGFAEQPLILTAFERDARGFHRLQRAAAGLDYSSREPNFTLALSALTAKLRRRSLVVIFSEISDPTSAELMVEAVQRLIRHHVVIFVTLEDAELARLSAAEPARLPDLARAVTADLLARQRALVLHRLRSFGIDVIDAPWQAIGYRLLDRYLAAKRSEAVG